MTFKFPVMAIISICHRASGVLLFLLLPLLLYLFQHSMASPADFLNLQVLLQNSIIKLLLFLTLASTVFHLLAGIRHLMMDLGLGESVCAGRVTAYLVFILSGILLFLAGAWLW